MAEDAGTEPSPITIKKYANRRLYNTASSSYVTLDHLAEMVKGGTDFVVYDAKSGEDITRSVLTHIIVEQESKGQNLLPIGFLRHLISFYGDSLQALIPRYLDHSMHVFARDQERMREYMRTALGGMTPFGPIEELGRQNVALFERTMRMLNPFHGDGTRGNEDDREERGEVERTPRAAPSSTEEFEEMRAKLDRMQKQLDELTGGRSGS